MAAAKERGLVWAEPEAERRHYGEWEVWNRGAENTQPFGLAQK